MFIAKEFQGQVNTLSRRVTLPFVKEILFDSVVVIPGSIEIKQAERVITSEFWKYDPEKKKLFISNSIDSMDITIFYRILSPKLSSSFFTIEKPDVLGSRRIYQIQWETKPDLGVRKTYQQLNKSGSLTRGVSVNNGGGFSLTGGLNLQMSGRVSENLWLTAVLSDANIPIQPEGTTAQIAELDKIYVSVYNERIRATVGDYVLNYNDYQFLRVNKKFQGFRFETFARDSLTEAFRYSSDWAGAVNRGKYHRQKLETIEGNQGPYKLKGANNETFIVVLAGSEQVYLNGLKLKRGENEDYVIDYNTAEIRFTPKQPISRESRAVVEFEYTDRTYVRMMVSHSSIFQNQNHRFEIRFYSESDAKYQTIDEAMPQAWIDSLRNAGDGTAGIFIPNVRQVTFDPEIISYEQADTIVGGRSYRVYRYSSNPQTSIYRVVFSYVGEKRGDYVIMSGVANGRVFGWVAPVDGVSQGNYAPVINLLPPQSKQNVAFRSKSNLGTFFSISSEVVYSHFDKNTFSDLDDNDNHSAAFDTRIEAGNDTTTWKAALRYRFIFKDFSTFDQFLPVEFDRDWNLSLVPTSLNHQQLGAFGSFNKKSLGRVGYQWEALWFDHYYRGFRNLFTTTLRLGSWKFNTETSLLKSTDEIKSTFARTQTRLIYEHNRLSAGVRLEAENNHRNLPNGFFDSRSHQFYDAGLFLNVSNTEKINSELVVGYRDDRKVSQSRIEPFTTAKYLQLSSEVNFSPTHSWGVILNLKNIDVPKNELFPNIRPETVAGGRLTNRVSVFKRLVTNSGFFEVGTGMESKKEFAFIRTVPGQGTHVWRDVNQNGIQELWEFEIATIPQEADFIRIFIPTNDFINAYYSTWSNSNQINFNRFRTSDFLVLRAISYLSNQNSITVRQRLTDDRFHVYANPLHWMHHDTTLLSNQVGFRNTSSIARNSSFGSIDFTYGYNQNRGILSAGFETRTIKTRSLLLRISPLASINVYHQFDLTRSDLRSDVFSFKDFTIEAKQWEGRLEYLHTQALRFEGSARYGEKLNQYDLGRSYLHEIKGGVQYSRLKTGTVNASISYVLVKFSGDITSPTTYELLDGLQIGRNIVWQSNASIRMTEKVNMDLQYHGRSGNGIKPIHTGTIQVKIYF